MTVLPRIPISNAIFRLSQGMVRHDTRLYNPGNGYELPVLSGFENR